MGGEKYVYSPNSKLCHATHTHLVHKLGTGNRETKSVYMRLLFKGFKNHFVKQRGIQ